MFQHSTGIPQSLHSPCTILRHVFMGRLFVGHSEIMGPLHGNVLFIHCHFRLLINVSIDASLVSQGFSSIAITSRLSKVIAQVVTKAWSLGVGTFHLLLPYNNTSAQNNLYLMFLTWYLHFHILDRTTKKDLVLLMRRVTSSSVQDDPERKRVCSLWIELSSYSLIRSSIVLVTISAIARRTPVLL